MALVLDNGIDHTVRKPGFDPEDVPDHSSVKGAMALAKRLEAYWAARGENRKFQIYRVGELSHNTVYGVRPKPTRKRKANAVKDEKRWPKARVHEFIKYMLNRYYPDVTLDAVLSFSRDPKVCAARKYCMRRAYAAGIVPSVSQLAKHFNRDHSTILFALRGNKGKITIKRESLPANDEFFAVAA